MLKRDEVSDPSSSLNKAEEDEPIFVLRAKDSLASYAVRQWADRAEWLGCHDPTKINEARLLSFKMDEWRASRHA